METPEEQARKYLECYVFKVEDLFDLLSDMDLVIFQSGFSPLNQQGTLHLHWKPTEEEGDRPEVIENIPTGRFREKNLPPRTVEGLLDNETFIQTWSETYDSIEDVDPPPFGHYGPL